MRDGDRKANVARSGTVRFRRTGWTTNSVTLRGNAHEGSNPSRLSNRENDMSKYPIGEAYDTGDQIVILGTPPDFPDSVPDDDPRRHNCDAMGCGCAHVLYRFHKPNIPLCGKNEKGQ